MTDPFKYLGLTSTNDVEAVRHAYHELAKKCHPDQFQDEEEQRQAHARMVLLNQAYEEALKLAQARSSSPYTASMACEDAVNLARRMLRDHSPESALRQLLRASTRSAEWYGVQGDVLMHMEQYESAEQSYREAVRLDPGEMRYRRGALDAMVALRNSRTLTGRIRKLLGRGRKH